MRENGADAPEMGAVLASPARRDVGIAPYKVRSDAPGIGVLNDAVLPDDTMVVPTAHQRSNMYSALPVCRRAGCEAPALGILLTVRGGGRKRPALRQTQHPANSPRCGNEIGMFCTGRRGRRPLRSSRKVRCGFAGTCCIFWSILPARCGHRALQGAVRICRGAAVCLAFSVRTITLHNLIMVNICDHNPFCRMWVKMGRFSLIFRRKTG